MIGTNVWIASICCIANLLEIGNNASINIAICVIQIFDHMEILFKKSTGVFL